MRLTFPLTDAALGAPIEKRFGTVTGAQGYSLRMRGLRGDATLGADLRLGAQGGRAQVIAFDGEEIIGSAYDSLVGVRCGMRVFTDPTGGRTFPAKDWLGRVIDPFGKPIDDRGPLSIGTVRELNATPPVATARKELGSRMRTGLCALNTFLPFCCGQRLGVFAGPGVGKSTLLGELIRTTSCDAAVIALIGERGREVRDFLETVLGEEGLERSVVIVATSDQAPLAKKRAAVLAVTVAESFRDDGANVLMVFDSLTRFAEAHREVALAAGEAPSLHAYPPSTFREIAALVERAGPGPEGSGDISAVFSVLVAGSDMNEPVADMIRGVLDGHLVLDRKIAERGRFPAIDLNRSISRSLPQAATPSQNAAMKEARAVVSAYEDAELMIRAGLYVPGSDPGVDRAIALYPEIDTFVGASETGSIEDSFDRLQNILDRMETEASERAS